MIDKSESIHFRIVTRVAESKGVDQTELPPLYETVDPDALEALFGPRGTVNRGETGCELRFSYAGHDVRIHDGEVVVDPAKPRSKQPTYD